MRVRGRLGHKIIDLAVTDLQLLTDDEVAAGHLVPKNGKGFYHCPSQTARSADPGARACDLRLCRSADRRTKMNG